MCTFLFCQEFYCWLVRSCYRFPQLEKKNLFTFVLNYCTRTLYKTDCQSKSNRFIRLSPSHSGVLLVFDTMLHPREFLRNAAKDCFDILLFFVPVHFGGTFSRGRVTYKLYSDDRYLRFRRNPVSIKDEGVLSVTSKKSTATQSNNPILIYTNPYLNKQFRNVYWLHGKRST